MKKFTLSLIAITCGIALTGCSSSSRGVKDYLDSSEAAAQIEASKKAKAAQDEKEQAGYKLLAAEEARDTAERKVTEAKEAETKANSDLAELQKEIDTLKQQLENTTTSQQETAAQERLKQLQSEQDALLKQVEQYKQATLEAEKDLANAENAKKAVEKELQDELTRVQADQKKAEDAEKATNAQKAELDKRIAELEKELKKAEGTDSSDTANTPPTAEELAAAQQRVENSVAEMKKAFTNPPTSTFKTETVIQMGGSVLSVEDGVLKSQTINPAQSLNQLVVDGKTVQLLSDEEILKQVKLNEKAESYLIKTLGNTDADGATVTGKVGSLPKYRTENNFSMLRYGYATVDGKTSLFVQGYATPAEQGDWVAPFQYYYYKQDGHDQVEGIPAIAQNGVWLYESGSAFYGKDGSYQELPATAIADLDNKKVRVDVTKANNEKLTFGGQIEGNTFEGKYQGIEAKGQFFGPRARDIGGTFYQTEGAEKEYHGVFGVTREENSPWDSESGGEDKSLKSFDVTK